MTVRIKFDCVSMTKRKGWGGHDWFYDYKFQVVVSGSDENKAFFASTPSGNLEFSTVADNQFEPGKSYYNDLTLVEELPAVLKASDTNWKPGIGG